MNKIIIKKRKDNKINSIKQTTHEIIIIIRECNLIRNIKPPGNYTILIERKKLNKKYQTH